MEGPVYIPVSAEGYSSHVLKNLAVGIPRNAADFARDMLSVLSS